MSSTAVTGCYDDDNTLGRDDLELLIERDNPTAWIAKALLRSEKYDF